MTFDDDGTAYYDARGCAVTRALRNGESVVVRRPGVIRRVTVEVRPRWAVRCMFLEIESADAVPDEDAGLISMCVWPRGFQPMYRTEVVRQFPPTFDRHEAWRRPITMPRNGLRVRVLFRPTAFDRARMVLRGLFLGESMRAVVVLDEGSARTAYREAPV